MNPPRTPINLTGRLSRALSALDGLRSSQGLPALRLPSLPKMPLHMPGLRMPNLGRRQPQRPETPLPAGARFLSETFAGPTGRLDYRLYIPATAPSGQALPLLVMLHGCTQTPEDFAAGTRMNALAEAGPFLVAWPEQTQAANAQRCWNWFNPEDQGRDRGEPALIAGMVRQVTAQHPVDPRRVHVAGLSAGGAAAAIMGEAYPELFAAIGVHSGLACGAARDLGSALSAMRRGGAAGERVGRRVPTIVFHADRDSTVHPVNGDQVIARAGAEGLHATTERGEVPGGHGFTCIRHTDAAGRVLLEQWLVHGGGHAWSGGDAAGSYTDPSGPDASRAMLHFFAQHSLAEG
ncbi:extracellular catalytic domain type 1 short-chain-length polyhydroxyalkanoate depolymerase [Falsiroseomonas selenitidurans]|uniref:PHB depolymerase family esterase n=1 Tax=Falsiroseomonas selenitidurans TaxID=2716335 RepID=A0ABX1E2W4_9PROT|nr:PHB depolymerase family esterase [Falsiroseomonas selenitidurans]NKC30158.1 PHB depolymerase family esterase [Falsiroseomonas selenitidurans]